MCREGELGVVGGIGGRRGVVVGGRVGWCGAEGNGGWGGTFRWVKVTGNWVCLFAGAGIVPASSPVGAWRETGVKLSTLLNVFGLH